MKTNICYQGDCLEIMKDIPDKSIDMILTDPPYGMNFQSHRRKDIYKKINNDDNLAWIDKFTSQSYRVLKENSHIYCFCSFHNVDVFKQSIEKLFKIKNILIWKKNNHGSGDLAGSYAPKYEMIIFAHKGRRNLSNGRQSDILEYGKTGNTLHPTEKPVDMFEYLIEKSSNEEQIILDPFAGSGTTSVACKNLNRNFILIEQDEKYCDIIKERVGCEIIKLL